MTIATLDTLTRELTAFDSFEQMISKQANGYRPTIATRRGDAWRMLADGYDAEAARRGLPLRCFRG